jgi:hypothetical protein
MDATVSLDEGDLSGRPSRVVLISRRWDQLPGQEPGGTVAKKPVHRGEHEATVNTNRACGNAGLFPVDLSTRVLVLSTFAHEAAGASAPGIPHALRAEADGKTRTQCAARTRKRVRFGFLPLFTPTSLWQSKVA